MCWQARRAALRFSALGTVTQFAPLPVRNRLTKAETDVPSPPETAAWFNTPADQELPEHRKSKCLKICRELFRSAESSLAQTEHSG